MWQKSTGVQHRCRWPESTYQHTRMRDQALYELQYLFSKRQRKSDFHTGWLWPRGSSIGPTLFVAIFTSAVDNHVETTLKCMSIVQKMRSVGGSTDGTCSLAMQPTYIEIWKYGEACFAQPQEEHAARNDIQRLPQFVRCRFSKQAFLHEVRVELHRLNRF